MNCLIDKINYLVGKINSQTIFSTVRPQNELFGGQNQLSDHFFNCQVAKLTVRPFLGNFLQINM